MIAMPFNITSKMAWQPDKYGSRLHESIQYAVAQHQEPVAGCRA